jgi:hypothetical protein
MTLANCSKLQWKGMPLRVIGREGFHWFGTLRAIFSALGTKQPASWFCQLGKRDGYGTRGFIIDAWNRALGPGAIGDKPRTGRIRLGGWGEEKKGG